MNDLLEAKDYLSLDHFIKTYEVSKRTIQNDLSYLMQMSSRKGYQLHMRRGRGYLLEVTNQELLNDFIKSLESDRLIDTKDRNKSIAVYLAMQSDYAVSYTHLEACYKRSVCPSCQGERLKEASRAITVLDKRLPEIVNLTLEEIACRCV